MLSICRVLWGPNVSPKLLFYLVFLTVGKLPDCSLERFERLLLLFPPTQQKNMRFLSTMECDLLLLLRGYSSLREMNGLLESLDPQCLTLSSAPGRFEMFALSRHGGGGS